MRCHARSLISGCLLVAALLAGPAAWARAADAKDSKKPAGGPVAEKGVKPAAKDASDESGAKPTPHVVKKGPMRIEVALDGTFEAQNVTELALHPQEWTGFTVLKAVEHGAVVRRGDLLVAMDPEKIDRAIADLRTEIQLSDLSEKQAEQQLAALEKAAPLDMDANQRTLRAAQEDWRQYLAVDKPLSAKWADFTLTMAKEALEYQEEELRQLEKMYKADDLVEETERIVLKRTRNAVDRARFSLEYARVMHDEMLKFGLPRQEDRMKEATQRAEIEHARLKISLPLAVSKQRIEFEKLKVQRAQSDEKLGKLLADRTAMTVKSPGDGIVYYGRCARGKWSGGSSGDAYRRGAAFTPNEVFMTLVQARPLDIRATVPENQLQHVSTGLQGIAEPVGFSRVKLPVAVQRLAAVPLSGGGFDVRLSIVGGPLPDAIMPGMTCEVKLTAYKKGDVLTIPPKAVFSEELDPLRQFVYRLGKGDKPEKRPVTLGKRNDKQVEILGGLSEGDKILLEKPKDP